ncbi:glycosyltransferase family 2 protein [Arthrobacter sp. MYb227]|uniref:glycosyltransferase family 2 protein n=1 Tax=Arthrobacter sp. MYb227 TaxID=1848601 RepID=UPI00215766A7|nr:glycosyltransferase family 2 protein [Arthrobacter sp. MYb227]
MHVTAVVAAHNGAVFLPRTLDALRDQTRLIDRFVGVDASSTDDSESLMRKHLPSDATILGVEAHSFGKSVKAAVNSLGKPKPGRTEWLWLIHDDSTPAPDALERLVTVVEATESVTIAGCKQLDLDSPRRLLDVGLGVNEYAERVTLIEIDEVDQGQYDARTDSFAVTSAGMLIRRDVFEALGGFDPALPGLGDDMDLCWRNRLLGNRVVVVPEAMMFHKAAVVRALAGPKETRRAEVFMRLKHAAGWKIPFLIAGAILGGLYRFIGSLLAKDPGYAFGQLDATFRAVGTPIKLSRSRKAAAKTRTMPRNAIARLLTDQNLVREHRKHMLESLDHAQVLGDGTGALTSEAPSGDSRNDFASLAAPARTSAFISAILAVLGTVSLSLIGLRSLIGAPAVAGGALLPLSTKASEIYTNATTWWQNLGAGIPGGSDPFDFLLWLAALLGVGHSNAAAVVLTLLVMPLAALSAWLGLGAVTRSRAARMIGGLLWGLAPVLQVSLASGRAGAMVVHILAPLLLLALLRTVGAATDFKRRNQINGATLSRPGFDAIPSWTGAAAASLLLAAIAAASPALGIASIVLMLLLAITLRSRAKTLWWVALPTLVFQAPLIIGAFENIRTLITDPGLPLAFAPAPLWAQALGFPVNFDPFAAPLGFVFLPDGPWALVIGIIIGAPLLGLSIVALFSASKRAALVRTLWLGGVLMLAAGYGASLIPVSVAGEAWVAPFNGPFISAFLVVMLFAATIGVAEIRSEHQEQPLTQGFTGTTSLPEHGANRGVLVLICSLMTLSLISGGATWLLAQDGSRTENQTNWGTASSLRAVASRTLPATAADRGLGPYEDRTLVLAPSRDGAISAALMNGAGTTADSLSQVASAERIEGGLLDPSVRADDAAEKLIESTVAMLVANSDFDPRSFLDSLGVGFVVLQESGETASALVAQLDSVQGLAPVGRTDAGWLWRVEPGTEISGADNATDFTSRVRITTNGQTTALLPSHRAEVRNVKLEPSTEPRQVVLAERADAGWKATLNGKPLTRVTVGPQTGGVSGTGGLQAQAWAQGFELGTEGGTLNVTYSSPYKIPVSIARWTVLILALLLVIPIPRSRRFSARRLDEYRTRGNAESIDELDRGQHTAQAKEKKS